MRLGNKTLVDRLATLPAYYKKRGGDTTPYSSKYLSFADYLEKNIHNEVTKAAILQALKDEDSDFETITWLNDHGPKHIAVVIERASQLLDTGREVRKDENTWLNAKELFFLLNAIQLHDVGNFFGRVNHEQRILEVVKDGLTPIVFDRTEATHIDNIARVHGGYARLPYGGKTKATISRLGGSLRIDGYRIRLQLLAAILRFADEIADEQSRADEKTLREGGMPRGSEVFHAYSACVDSVHVDHGQKVIEVHLKVPKSYLTRTFGKIDKDKDGKMFVRDVHIVDEIYERALKMHYERIYCSKFWSPMLDLQKLWVQIKFYGPVSSDDTFDPEELHVHPDITFTLVDNGYPSEVQSIFDLCDTLRYDEHTPMTGANIADRIKKR